MERKLFATMNNSLIIRIFQLKSLFMIPIDLSIYPAQLEIQN